MLDLNKVKCDWDNIPTDFTIPSGDIDFIGVSAEILLSNDPESPRHDPDKVRKLMVKIAAQVEKPEIAKGMFFNNWYVLGNDDKPEEMVSGTMGTIQFKQLLVAANVPAAGNLGTLCKGFEGALFGASIKNYEDDSGRMQNDIIGKPYKRGEKKAAVLEGGRKTVGAVKVKKPEKLFKCPDCGMSGMTKDEYVAHECPK